MADSRFFVDVFGEIVDSMRATGAITNSVEATGTYTLTTVNTFSAFDSISILDADYLISAATATTLTISAATGLDFTGETWKDLAPYYEYGHPIEVSNTLSLKDKNPLLKYNKYPLIYLLTDITESSGENIVLEYSVPISILIVNSTKKTYVSKERMDINVKPILNPLYESLLDCMAKSQYLFQNDRDRFSKDKIIRLYWGSTGIYGNEALIFNDPLDAIEVNFDDIEVIKNNYTCQ